MQYSNKEILKIAFPILFSVLMQQIVGMTDTAFLGRVSEVDLGACALGNIFFTAVFMIGLGFSVGSQIVMGRRNGEGRCEEVGRVFYHSLIFLLVLGVVLFALVRGLTPWVLPRILTSQEVCAATEAYLFPRAWGFFFAFIAISFRTIYVATTRTRMLTWNALVMVVANVVLNYVLIFGHYGFPAMGIRGAAIASVISEALSAAFFIFYTFGCFDFRKYGLAARLRFSFPLVGQILRVSVWVMIQNFLSLATWFIFFVAVEHLGEEALASSNIVRNISAITFMTLISLSTTASTLTSNLMGAGRADEVWPRLTQQVCRLTWWVLLPVLLFFVLMPRVVFRIFTDDAALIDVSIGPLYVLLSSYLVNVFTQVYLHVISGTGNTKAASLIELVALGLYALYILAFIDVARPPLPVCWTAEHVYTIPCFLMAWWYLKRGTWKKKQV